MVFSNKAAVQPSRPIDELVEQIITQQAQQMSDAELMVLLVGSGLSDVRAHAFAKDLMLRADDSLMRLTTWQLSDFLHTKGMTQRKAAAVMAALELSRRLRSALSNRKISQIKTASDIYALMKVYLDGLTREEFWIILLNQSAQVLRVRQVFVGGIHATSVDAKVVFRFALGEPTCSQVILVHNHPSGRCLPSATDVRITERLATAGKALDLKVLDHVIYTDGDYFSFIEQGLLR